MSAVLGSLFGGSATMATAWITQRKSTKRELIPHRPSERLIPRNGLHQSLADLVATALGLGGPELVDAISLGRIETFHEPVSEKGSLFARQGERFLGDLLDGH